MRKSIVALGVVAGMIPVFVSAALCPNLYRNLERGMSGEDVRQLQQFLIERGHLATGNATSYFGPLTEAAVQQFQCAEDIVCSGSPSETGWGRVGPKTRAAIANVCGVPGGGSSATMSASPVSGIAPLSVTFAVNVTGAMCSYTLDYGDGAKELITSCGAKSLQHSFASQGNYTARLSENVQVGGQVIPQLRAQQSIAVGQAVREKPTCTMNANRTSIAPNDAVTLTWSSTNATSAQWGDGSVTGTSGSAIFTGITQTTTKSINFTGPGGSTSCGVTITVTTPPTTTGAVTVTGNAIANGGVATLASGLNANYKLAEFSLKAEGESILLNSLLFTLRNQKSNGEAGAASIANVRTLVQGTSYVTTTQADGIYTDHRVSLLSGGVTIPINGNLSVSVLADIMAAAPGTVDLWIYPEDMQFQGAASGNAITATSNVTNRVDPALLYWSGWISTGGGGVGGASCTFQGQTYPDGATGPCPSGIIHNDQCVFTGTAVWQFKNVCRNGVWKLESNVSQPGNGGPLGGTASCLQQSPFWQGQGQTYPHEATVCSVNASCWFAARCCNGKWYAGGNIIGAGPHCAFWAQNGSPGF